MSAKKKEKNIPIPIMIILMAAFLYGIYTGISSLTLAVFGDSVIGTVDRYSSRRESDTASQNRSRTAFKGYYFFVDGKEYSGYVSYLTDDAWANLDEGETRSERINYLPFFPYVNRPSAMCDFDEIGTGGIITVFILPIGCTLLMIFIIKTYRKEKKHINNKEHADG